MAVSVIMKSLNEEARIADAIESVLVALEHIGGDAIVADGGSRDRTVEIARRYPIRVVQLAADVAPSCGIGPQLGFQYSREPFVCLMDGDMQLDPAFLDHAVAFLEAHPSAAGVTGHVREMNVSNLEFTRRVQRKSPENRVGTIDRMNGGGLYRRKAIDQVGYLSDRNLHGYEEFELGLRLRSGGWDLHRLDRDFVRHYGHTIDAYALLVRRWRSGYLRGIGEVLRAALGQPYWPRLWRELPELKLWCGLYGVALVLVALPVVLSWVGLIVDGAAILAIVAAMAVRQKSLALGTYTIVAWLFHAAALPLGFLQTRKPPQLWIESVVLSDAAR